MADRAPLALRTLRQASLIIGGSLLAAGALLPKPALANFAYGIDDQQRIRQVNLTDLSNITDSVLLNAANTICAGLSGLQDTYCRGTGGTDGDRQPYYSNSFALDKVREQFFFLDYKGQLQYWDFKAPTVQVVGTQNQVGLANTSTRTAFTANASYYNDAYWYFISNTACAQGVPTTVGSCPLLGTASADQNKLVKVALNYSGATPTVASFEQYVVPNLPSAIATTGAGADFTFGDIAIKPDGTLYGATVAGGFYTMDLTSCSGGTCGAATVLRQNNPTTPPPVGGTNPSLQIAFDSAFDKLYGQTFSAGGGYAAAGWGTVDYTGNGLYTQTFSNPTGSVTALRDISAISEKNQDVPGPLPLLGAGAAFSWTRRLRRRLGQAQALRSSR